MAARLQPIHVPNPAWLGLNKQKEQVVQEPSWCIDAQHAIVDGAGRLAARKGRSNITTVAVESGSPIRTIHEYLNASGTSIIVSATTLKLYTGTTTLTDRTGVLVPTAGHWQFVNFNGNVYGWQASHTPITYNGAGNFAALVAASGALPTGNAAVAAFGRIWAVDADKQTIKYSALLDATKWAAVDGGGSIDMRSVWTKGIDEIVALASYGSNFVVFGKRHIFIWTDGSGGQLGIVPTEMYVAEVIEGIGCVARDSISLIGEVDVLFWSQSGVRSLGRVLQEKATPINDVSANNRQYVADFLTISSATTVKSVYSPNDGFYLLISPNANVAFWFDTKSTMEGGALRMCEWPAFTPTAAASAIDGTIYLGGAGKIERYFGFSDNGVSYRFIYGCPWTDAGDGSVMKLGKEIAAVCLAPQGTPVVFSWWTDFKSNPHSSTVSLNGGAVAEYGTGLYSTDEYGGSLNVKELRVPMMGGTEWRYARFGIQADINGFPFAINSATLYVKPSRMA